MQMRLLHYIELIGPGSPFIVMQVSLKCPYLNTNYRKIVTLEGMTDSCRSALDSHPIHWLCAYP